MVRFSVVVSVYNIASFVAKCLSSIEDQKFRNFEVIVVNDGSSDNSLEICSAFVKKNPNFRLINQENKGHIKARDAGFRASVGEYIVPVDGDDWIDPEYLLRFQQAIERYGVDIVCCGYTCAFENSRHNYQVVFDRETGYIDRNSLEKKIFPILIESERGECFPPTIWAKAFKREIYSTGTIKNNNFQIGEDQAFVKPCIYRASSIYVINEALYYYRQNELSITKVKKPMSLEGPEIVGRHLSENIKDNDFAEQIDRCVTHYLMNAVLSQFHRRESLENISRDIKITLANKYYKDIINRVDFAYLKGKIAKVALKMGNTYVLYFMYLIRCLIERK